MPTIPHTAVPLPTLVDFDGVRVRQWTSLANSDDGEPIILTRFSDKTVQFGGTFGVGGTVILEGSVDGVQWDSLKDVFGNALSATGAKLYTVTENPVYLRPRVTGGDGTTSITVKIAVR